MRACRWAIPGAAVPFMAASCLRKVDVCTRWRRIPCARRQPPLAFVLLVIPWALRPVDDLDVSVCRQDVQRFARPPDVLQREGERSSAMFAWASSSFGALPGPTISALACSVSRFHAAVQRRLRRHRRLDLFLLLLPTLAASVPMQLCQGNRG